LEAIIGPVCLYHNTEETMLTFSEVKPFISAKKRRIFFLGGCWWSTDDKLVILAGGFLMATRMIVHHHFWRRSRGVWRSLPPRNK